MIVTKKRKAEQTSVEDESVKKNSKNAPTNEKHLAGKEGGTVRKLKSAINNSVKTGSKKPTKGDLPHKKGHKSLQFGKKTMHEKSGKGADSVANDGEKTDWRKFKQEKKELKLKRKKSKDSYEISIEAKHIYEKLKCRRTENKAKLVEKLYDLLSPGDTIKKLVMAHDTARVIQCMLKFAAPTVREQFSEKLLPLAVDMAMSKYSQFCVLRMFKYGSPTIKSKLVDSFLGNIVKLANHNISNSILDHVYLNVASAQQKCFMRQEFYSDLYRKSKDNNVKQLSDTYKDTATMKTSILGAVKLNLEHLANKQLVDNSLVHAVIVEYLNECDEEKMEEAVTLFAPLIPLMLTTKDGCQASIICFYKSTSKNRRVILKTIKEHLIKICTHESGHIFVIALLNSLDDTKATKKSIYDVIHPKLQTLMTNPWGRRVVEWLVSPGDTSCFHPSFIATIENGLQYGKKDKDTRRKEIFEQIEGAIVSTIEEDPEFWVSNGHIGLVTAEILKKVSTENFVKAATALVTVIVNPSWTVQVVDEETKEKKTKKLKDMEQIIEAATKLRKKKQLESKAADVDTADGKDEDEEENEVKEIASKPFAGIEEAGLHIVLKKIIKNDKERLAQDAEATTFGTILVDQLTADTMTYWLTVNRGCFVLLNIIENNNEQTLRALQKLLESHLSALKEQTFSGAKLLLKKIV